MEFKRSIYLASLLLFVLPASLGSCISGKLLSLFPQSALRNESLMVNSSSKKLLSKILVEISR